MANISISDLYSDDSARFSDSEGFMRDLSENDLKITGGDKFIFNLIGFPFVFPISHGKSLP